jgi:hypothetical protein
MMIKKFGMMLLGAWLVMKGLIALLNLSFDGLNMLMALLALAAGILIIVNR